MSGTGRVCASAPVRRGGALDHVVRVGGGVRG